MTKRSTQHETFTIERFYPQTPETVFAAFADEAIKRRWFVEGEGWAIEEYTLDFRLGGFERSRFRFKDGSVVTNDTVYQDIVENERIVLAYWMSVDGQPLSASMTTIELKPEGTGTRLTYIEYDVFFEGLDTPESRESGCRALLEALAATLDA